MWIPNIVPYILVAFKALGKLILDVGLLLAYHCDGYGKYMFKNCLFCYVFEMTSLIVQQFMLSAFIGNFKNPIPRSAYLIFLTYFINLFSMDLFILKTKWVFFLIEAGFNNPFIPLYLVHCYTYMNILCNQILSNKIISCAFGLSLLLLFWSVLLAPQRFFLIESFFSSTLCTPT